MSELKKIWFGRLDIGAYARLQMNDFSFKHQFLNLGKFQEDGWYIKYYFKKYNSNNNQVSNVYNWFNYKISLIIILFFMLISLKKKNLKLSSIESLFFKGP